MWKEKEKANANAQIKPEGKNEARVWVLERGKMKG